MRANTLKKQRSLIATAMAAAACFAGANGLQAGEVVSINDKLLVDFNSTTQGGGPHNEFGYEPYNAAHENAASFGTRTYPVAFPHVGSTSVSVTPTWPNTTAASVQQSIDRSAGNDANWDGDKIDLLTDWIGSDTRISQGGNGNYDGGTSTTPTYLNLSLGNLPASNYEWVSYHHDTENMHTEFIIELSTDGGESFTTVHMGQATDSTPGGNPDSGMEVSNAPDGDPINLSSTARFEFPTGGDEVILRFTPLANTAVHRQFFLMNGFELCDLGDFIPPVITVPKDIVINSTGPTEVEYGPATATDETAPANPEVTCTPPSGSVFPIGTTKVSCTATDAFGNPAEECFFVSVLEIQPSPSERDLDSISLRGDFVPGAAPGTTTPGFKGATLFTYQRAFLNNSGQVLLEATLSGAGINNSGVFTNVNGGLQSIGIKNAASPAGPDYLAFKNHSLSDDGVAAFGARTTGGDVHNTDTGASTTLQVGMTPPGLAGDPLTRAIFQPALGGDGQLFSPVSLTLGSGAPAIGVNADTVIWSSDDGAVAREGEPAQDLPAGIDYGHLFSRVVSNENNEVAFSGNLIGGGAGSAAVWSGPAANLSVVARRGDSAPGGTFASFAAESISPSGDIAFRGKLAIGGGVLSANNECIWTNRNGAVQLVAREGAAAPCIDETGVFFDRFGTLIIGSDGSITFLAYLKGETISSANDCGIWRSDSDGAVHLVAREADEANNTDGSVYQTLQAVAANNNGGALFFALLKNGIGDTETKNNFGAWLDRGEDDPAPQLIVRKSDTFEFAPKDERTILSIGFDYVDNGVGGTGGYGRTLNDSAELLLKLTLNGGVSGVFTFGEEEENKGGRVILGKN